MSKLYINGPMAGRGTEDMLKEVEKLKARTMIIDTKEEFRL